MNTHQINFDLLFDASEYWESGHCPWTFFAYPSEVANESGLPPDSEACRLLAELQTRGIPVAVWIGGPGNGTNYFACKKDDIHRLNEAIAELEQSGSFPINFCTNKTEQLHSTQSRTTHGFAKELVVSEVIEIEGRGTAVFFRRDPEPKWPPSTQSVRITTPDEKEFTAIANVEFARKIPSGEVMGLLFEGFKPIQIPRGSTVVRIEASHEGNGT